ncbi:MAG: bifunctional 5,10-methylenetetrahydrofolate dehydrogenase/5,10-methenyltetrahydrofolate cyclohydrolase [Spirochaetaceae bacterium]|jgi:methylenetetrahydrofolate dehydrogenase (NADP+)/methenyltetrahydrofolate cyclohydrolase|nr:bifunctional 5,10-methylenetetrahydrofolate dehydrogenase/5,10-methenyltetrahydrofolate cyclohydrolase [Spirochaetaceae bacterium]
MARLLTGAPVAGAILEGLRREAEALRARGIAPALALVRLGSRADDVSYERGILRQAGAAGIAVNRHILPLDAGQGELAALVRGINADTAVHGALIFRPLPARIDGSAIAAALDPAKDMDGISPGSLAAVYGGGAGLRGFAPCTAEACLAILDHYGIGVAGKRVAVIGRSLVAGRPAAMLFLHRDATVTICHSKTAALDKISREADIVVAALGRPEFLGAPYFRPGQTVIDVGIHSREDGTLCGDVRFAEAEALVEALSPVPGGAGAVTTALLLRHLVHAAGSPG